MLEAVLGHPYSGALYGYFADQLAGDWSHTKHVGNHSYYRTLYGKNYEAYVEVALTFLLLYDRIWLTPADNPMPQSRVFPENRAFIPELGLHADWEDFRPYRSFELQRYAERYLEDSALQNLLKTTLKLPEHSWKMIVESAVYEAGLSRRKRCPLLCSPGRRALIQRLIDIDRPALHPVLSSLHELQFIESYRSLTGMALRPRSLDDLMDAKPDKAVRGYGAKFLDVAFSETGPSSPATELRVAALIREAIETQRISSLFAGGLKWIGALFRFADFGVGSATASTGSFASQYVADQSGWYEFSGSIDRAIDKAKLIRQLDSVLERASNA